MLYILREREEVICYISFSELGTYCIESCHLKLIKPLSDKNFPAYNEILNATVRTVNFKEKKRIFYKVSNRESHSRPTCVFAITDKTENCKNSFLIKKYFFLEKMWGLNVSDLKKTIRI